MEKILIISQNHLIGLWRNITHIQSGCCRNTKSSSLAKCIVDDSFMFTKNVSFCIYKITRD